MDAEYTNDHRRTTSHLRSALAAYQTLQDILARQPTAQQSYDGGMVDTGAALQAAKGEADKLKNFFSAFLGPIFYNERCTSPDNAAPTARRFWKCKSYWS